MTGVPGQHLEATRRAIRKALRARGLSSGTRSIEGTLIVWSDDAYNALDPEELSAIATPAIKRIIGNETTESAAPPRSSQATIGWGTWVADP